MSFLMAQISLFASECEQQFLADRYGEAYECFVQTDSSIGNLSVDFQLFIIETTIEKGDFIKAMKLLNEHKEIVPDGNYQEGRLSHLAGLCHFYLADYPKALESYFSSVDKYFECDSLAIMADVYLNIGTVYSKLEQTDEVYKYYNKALELFSSENNLDGIARSMNNLGIYYRNTFNFDSAVQCFDSSLIINTQLVNYAEIAAIYNNKGIIFDMKGDPDKALTNFKNSLDLNKKYGVGTAIGDSYLQIGSFFNSVWEYDSALVYLNKAKIEGERQRSLDLLQQVYYQIYVAKKNLGDARSALLAYETYTRVHEKLNNEESVKQLTRVEMQYQFRQARKEQEYQILKQRVVIYVSLFGLVVMLGVAGLLLRSYRVKQRDNLVLEKKNNQIIAQRDEILFQKKEITDSIEYASRIQQAVLPQKQVRERLLSEHCVFYKPRNIVSGDFYWLAEDDEEVYLAVADCTGHGVPGAFMSLLGISFLNEIFSSSKKMSPSILLGDLRDKIISYLHQTGETGGNKDGMDMGLVSVDFKTLKVKYSGAYNSLYVVRNGELIEHKADRMPVSYYLKLQDYSEIEFQGERGDVLYMFSDGFADQFGGPNGKKFKYKTFKQMLVECAQLPVDAQNSYLDKRFNDWKLDYEQIDDVVVVGLKL